MAITVKKKAIAEATAPEEQSAEAAPAPAGPPPVGPPPKQASFTGSFVCALIALICYILLLAVQWIEYNYY